MITDAEFEAQNREAVGVVAQMRKGVKPKTAPGCIHETISLGKTCSVKDEQPKTVVPEPQEDDYPDTEFEEYALPEEPHMENVDFIPKLKSMCRNVLPLALVSVTFFWGVLSGNITGEMGWPISWGCSLLAAFSAGVILFKK